MNAPLALYSVDSSYGTALFVGDAVKSSGTADADGNPGVEQAAAGNTILGVIQGIVVQSRNGVEETPGYIAASTGGLVLVNIDPNTIYEVQEDGNAGLVATGNTADHVVAAGSTTTGSSGMELDSSDVGTGAGWKILRPSPRIDNEPANANAKWHVVINESEFDGAGVGV
jgi:hypothetical protein